MRERERDLSLSHILKLKDDFIYENVFFNEDIDISKLKTYKDIQNLRRNNENDYKELDKLYYYGGEKENNHICKILDQYHEKIHLRREFFEGQSVDKGILTGTADPKEVDKIDKEIEDRGRKSREANIAYLNSKEHEEELARFKREAKEEEEKAKAEKKKE